MLKKANEKEEDEQGMRQEVREYEGMKMKREREKKEREKKRSGNKKEEEKRKTKEGENLGLSVIIDDTALRQVNGVTYKS